jgi:hypothetical protein
MPCLWDNSAFLPAISRGFLSKKEPLRGYLAYLALDFNVLALLLVKNEPRKKR